MKGKGDIYGWGGEEEREVYKRESTWLCVCVYMGVCVCACMCVCIVDLQIT